MVGRRSRSHSIREDAQDKFKIQEMISSTGFPQGKEFYTVKAENVIRVVADGAGPTNEVEISARILDGSTPVLLNTIVGDGNFLIDSTAYDYLKIETTVYGGTPFELTASGFLC